MPSLDFWLDWRPRATVDQLRRILPAIAEPLGLRVVERQLITTSSGWAMLDLVEPDQGAGAIGTMRAQENPGGGAQLFVAPGARRDQAALDALNRAAVALYCGLLGRGLLAPPAPMEPLARPLIAPEA